MDALKKMKKEDLNTITPQDIDIRDYAYPLPEDRIAKFPLEERDASKLLIYREGSITQNVFRELPQELPRRSLLVFNNTRVIHARLVFHRSTGARIEVFCLEPLAPASHLQSLSSEGPVVWKCLIGNNKKWKEETLILPIDTAAGRVNLTARRLERLDDAFLVQFDWDRPGISFGELLHDAGLIPLPPYLNRENTPEDEDRYQTVYAQHDGSVAAPTAGLHFSDRVFDDLKQKNIESAYVTLHVGAGTFQPVKATALSDHRMHEEHLAVSGTFIETLLQALEEDRPVIPVGTTSMRTVESLYWFGVKCLKSSGGEATKSSDLVDQWAPYGSTGEINVYEALNAVLRELDRQNLDLLTGPTSLLIAPGYRFRIADGLITNFHQPQSTLLLLIAALVGNDWRNIYDYALKNDFRFLSYGDSSLLFGSGKGK